MQYSQWMEQMQSAALFDLTHTAAAPLLYPIMHSIGTIGGETWKE